MWSLDVFIARSVQTTAYGLPHMKHFASKLISTNLLQILTEPEIGLNFVVAIDVSQ